MAELHLWDPEVEKYSACGPFTRHKQRIDQFMKDGILSHIAKNKLDAACFQHDSAYNKYKNSVKRKQSDTVVRNKALKIATDPRVNGYHRSLAAVVYKFINERTKGLGLNFVKNSLNNEMLAKELHKQIIRNFKRRNLYSSFISNSWDVGLADIS